MLLDEEIKSGRDPAGEKKEFYLNGFRVEQGISLLPTKYHSSINST
jgi:hypothetical protein